MKKFDLVIKNGNLVLETEIAKADIGISSGVIQAIGADLSGKQVIAADQMFVIPGGIDPHVHLEMPTGKTISSDDWNSGTRAAAIGGTTTVIDFIEPEPMQSLMEAFYYRKQQADRGSWIDYGLHMTITDADPETLGQIPGIVEAGIPSFKVYTTYDFKLCDEELLQVMQAVGISKGLLLVHSENDAIVQYKRNLLIEEGHTGPSYHPISRPAAAEGEAVERVLALAHVAKSAIYIVHVSTQLGAQAIQRALARGQDVTGETCPQYLLLTEDKYQKPGFEPAKYICSPPLRTETDNKALWKALNEKILQTIGTDHCPFFFNGQKDIGKDLFTKVPGGMPGIESRIALIYSYGVKKNLISLEQWVKITSTNPARVFGLYPRKGAIKSGSDADLVIFDPQRTGVISTVSLHENVDYSPYEGFKYTGYPVMTILRGELIAKDNELITSARIGKFLERKASH